LRGPAARVLEPSSHLGQIVGPGVPTVVIGTKPAAVVGDLHVCATPPNAPHPPSPIVVGSTTVLIGGRPAARIDDKVGCGAMIAGGATNVWIGD
jgi:uncharacterized Zn-binding protein involved in type VI secretion